MFAVIALIAVLLYFLPVVLAVFLNSRDVPGIFLLNLFLGWSIVGWLFALFWTIISPRRITW